MPPLHFPLRWESTGDQWWYASPIDFAAANGHYDLVRELLHLDTNLLIKLTSLRRIRRLETVWDDEEQFNDVANCRASVAKKLLLECETKKGHNTLIRAGYGGWLLYTAASAGDVTFVTELLERDPLLVFGEGEYGVTDILYAAARSKNCEIFRMLLNMSNLRQCEEESESCDDFRQEMMNRAVHAASRGGNLEILKELLGDCSNVLAFRDAQGSTILHSASGRGQVEVVRDLIASCDIVSCTDYQGNTALHVAAYRGYLAVAEILILAASTLTSITNNYGDTFLHIAVLGFRSHAFRRVDRQIELVKQLVNGKIVKIQDIINVRNKDGRTALHLAVIENVQSNLVELLMSVPYINLNIRDIDGMTPLDLLRQRPRTASSEILIKQLIAAGGISNCQGNIARSAIASHIRWQGIGTSPGTSFRIPDAEIFLYTGIENASDGSCGITSVDFSEASECRTSISVNDEASASVNNAARPLKSLLQWRRKRVDEDPLSLVSRSLEHHPIPLRQRFSKFPSRSSNNGMFSVRSSLPSPLTRKKFTAGLTQGVIQAMPYLSVPGVSPSSPLSLSSMDSPLEKKTGTGNEGKSSTSQSPKDKQPSLNKKLMNEYFCFGAQGMVVENSISYAHQN